MATLQLLAQAAQNPNARRYLDMLSAAEGTTGNGYQTAFGGGRLASLDSHPGTAAVFQQTNGRRNVTTAAGRYQFLRPTWQGLARQYGFRDFGPRNQDLGALALIAQSGALDDVLQGRFDAAIRKTGRIWASLPSSPYAQKKRDWGFVSKALGRPSQQPQYLSAQDVQRLFPAQPTHQPQYLSDQDAQRLFSHEPQFLSDEQVKALFPG